MLIYKDNADAMATEIASKPCPACDENNTCEETGRPCDYCDSEKEEPLKQGRPY